MKILLPAAARILLLSPLDSQRRYKIGSVAVLSLFPSFSLFLSCSLYFPAAHNVVCGDCLCFCLFSGFSVRSIYLFTRYTMLNFWFHFHAPRPRCFRSLEGSGFTLAEIKTNCVLKIISIKQAMGVCWWVSVFGPVASERRRQISIKASCHRGGEVYSKNLPVFVRFVRVFFAAEVGLEIRFRTAAFPKGHPPNYPSLVGVWLVFNVCVLIPRVLCVAGPAAFSFVLCVFVACF